MLHIQPVRISDHYTTIDALMRALHVSEQELFNKTDEWNVIRDNYMRHVMDMQEQYNGTCLLAYEDETVAGFIFGYEEDDDDDSRIEAYTGKDLYVSDGYVLPAYRRMGIYKALNDALEAIYIAKGVRRILRFTLTSNTRMQRFLERAQYQPVRLLYEKWLTPDGKGVERLSLKPPPEEQ